MKKAKKGSDLQIELEKVYDKFAGVNEDEIDEDVNEDEELDESLVQYVNCLTRERN